MEQVENVNAVLNEKGKAKVAAVIEKVLKDYFRAFSANETIQTFEITLDDLEISLHKRPAGWFGEPCHLSDLSIYRYPVAPRLYRVDADIVIQLPVHGKGFKHFMSVTSVYRTPHLDARKYTEALRTEIPEMLASTLVPFNSKYSGASSIDWGYESKCYPPRSEISLHVYLEPEVDTDRVVVEPEIPKEEPKEPKEPYAKILV